MTRYSRQLAVIVAALSVFSGLSTTPLHAADESKPRVKLVMSSAERVLGDLKWIVADLAQERSQWKNNIFPSLDIFLLGVDRDKPIRWDVLIGGEDKGADNPGEYRFQPSIPVNRNGKDVRTFIKDNLEPIGIDVRQKRRGGYYQLSGGVFDGWLRMVNEYACIGTFESDVPKKMSNPGESHNDLLAKGYDIALEIDNHVEQTEARKDAFDVFQMNIIDAAKPKDGESEASFALRKGSLEQQMDRLRSLWVDARRITVGWTTDVPNQSGRADLYGEGLPDTGLAQFIELISVEPSAFASLTMPEDPAASLRVNLPFSEKIKSQLKESYDLTRPVLHETIDDDDSMTSAEKGPAKQVSDLLFDMLTDGIELGRLDLFVDMTKGEQNHVIIVGVRAADGKKADEIVKLIHEAHQTWSVETAVEEVGDTTIHKLNISGDLPSSISSLFGKSGVVYVGTSAEIVWVCGGEGSLELLKSTITKVAQAEVSEEVSPVFGEFKIHAHTLLDLYHNLVIEMDWSPLGTIEVSPRDGGGGTGLQPIDPAEIREIALKATGGIDDRVSGEARRIDNHAEGEVLVAPGLLRAVGKIIAKIAADNL